MKIFLALLTALVAVGGIGCSKSTDGPRSAAAPTAPPVTKPPPLVGEIVALLYSNDTQAGGSVTFTDIDSCKGVKFAGRWEAAADQKVVVRYELSVLRHTFEPGVEHRFEGRVCLPAPETPYREDAKADFQWQSVLVKDLTRAVIDGAVTLTGSVTFTSDKTAGKLFVIDSDATAPLTLAVTREGYRHVTGKGSLTTPDGKRYDFR